MKERRLLFRTVLLVLGSFVMGGGIGLAIASGFGSDPLAVLWDGMSHTFGISITAANVIMAAVLMVVSLVIDRRQLNLGTLVYEIMLTLGCEVTLHVAVPAATWFRLLAAVLGIALMGAGAGVYAAASLGKGPYEAAVFGISTRFGIRIAWVRMGFDLLFLISGFLLGGTVGVGTVLAFLGVGILIEKTAGLTIHCFHLESFQPGKNEEIKQS